MNALGIAYRFRRSVFGLTGNPAETASEGFMSPSRNISVTRSVYAENF